jgi:hypothetical protein
LLPQAVLLFNYENYNENKLTEQAAINDTNLKMTKQEKSVLRIEKFIMELNYNFFFKSCITERHFRDKRSLVDNVLDHLVERQLLYEGHDDTAFFDTGRVSTTKTYLKFVPSVNDEQRFRDKLSQLYNIEYEDYKKRFENAPLLPQNCQLTSHGIDFIRQPQYESIINKKSRIISGVFFI